QTDYGTGHMSSSKQTDYGTGHDFEEFIEELLNQNGIHAKVPDYDSVEKSYSTKSTRYKSDDDFKFYIENLLSGNRILVNSFNSRKDKIDIIATFNRQIILIHLSNSSDVNSLKGLQTSVSRFGEGILSVIVQNSEHFNNSSTKNERSYHKIKIVTEKMIVNYIKNRVKNNYKRTSHKKYANPIGRRENDVWSGSKQKIGDNVSWICSECTYINNPIMPDCEMCSTARTATNNFIEEINTTNQLEIQDYISTARTTKNKSFEEINTTNQLEIQDYISTARTTKNKSFEEINNINQLENQDYISTERPAKNNFIEAINEHENQDYISTTQPAKYNFLDAINQLDKHNNFFFEPMAEISKNKNLCLEQQWDCPECTLINESDVVMCI
ncbi:8050_t:CDS:2, partial [Gigaspora margarita]